jgi:hypothetical protein
MEHSFTNDAPVLVIDLAVGVVGFLLSIGWGAATGREMDRDNKVFFAKMWGGIALFGMILVFIF